MQHRNRRILQRLAEQDQAVDPIDEHRRKFLFQIGTAGVKQQRVSALSHFRFNLGHKRCLERVAQMIHKNRDLPCPAHPSIPPHPHTW